LISGSFVGANCAITETIPFLQNAVLLMVGYLTQEQFSMSDSVERLMQNHVALSRRYFLGLGVAGAAALKTLPLQAEDSADSPALQAAIRKLEPWLTPLGDFRDVSRGKPVPHSLSDEKKAEVGMTRDTWKLEVLKDPDKPARVRNEFKKSDDTAFDFAALMELAKTKAVRFPKVMTCLNIGCPLGMGIWEGVPLRELIWLAQPTADLRRVFYYGYHNEEPSQMFRSSMPVGRILEDPFDLPPIILCYKLNGQWLSSERGGPVRIVVPEAYGFKSIKWLSHLFLSNLHSANDTYAGGNNDVDSPLKSFAATFDFPAAVKPGQPIPVTGYAQAGISNVSKVQVFIHNNDDKPASGDKYFTKASWVDAKILPPPAEWGGGLPDDQIPAGTLGYDAAGQPKTWPMRLAKVHWATLLPGMPEGKYTLRSRTIDGKGQAQPMPRPFRKSGHAAIEQVTIDVKA
jgi:DMSO/TMAO reductase YedYZ molybdopterin-dependent catalytic subunit